MTFFYRQMPRLVAEGHLYVAQPPLYMISSGKKERRYLQTEDEMQATLIETGLAGASLRKADANSQPMKLLGTNSRAYSIWLSTLNKGCEHLAAETVPSVIFCQWRIFPRQMIPQAWILAMACFPCSSLNMTEEKSGFIARENV